MPSLTLPLVAMGVIAAPFGLFVTIVNGVIVAPECIVAFWHRCSACIWLSLNTLVVALAIALIETATKRTVF